VTDEDFLLVSLARHCLQKNSYGLLRAFAAVAQQRPTARLIIAGRPDDPAYALQLVHLRDRLRCADRAHLHDHTSAPATLLAAADAYVSNSYFEGASLASIEALCQGTRVVISDVGDAREQVGDDPRRGVVVANPLADPLRVDWRTIGASRFRSQLNEAELIGAMVDAVDLGPDGHDARLALRAESLQRFNADRVLDEHARVLAEAVGRF
jgi:glycosyltransferase involved in cell wall biosynthesis